MLEKSHRGIFLRKVVAVTGETGGDIYTVGNNLSKSAWAKTHPTDTTTDSLSLAIKRHSFSWVSERDLVGFGLGCFLSRDVVYWRSQRISRRKCSSSCFLHSSSVLLYLLIFLFHYFFPLYHCPVRKITWSTADAFFWEQDLQDWTYEYTQSLQLLQIKKQPTLLFMYFFN